MPRIDPAWIVVAPLLLLFWRPMRERVFRSAPFPPRIGLRLETLFKPSNWLHPTHILKMLGFLPIPEVDHDAYEAAGKLRIAEWVNTNLPNVGDWTARFRTFSDTDEDGWFKRQVPASIHDTVIRVTKDRAVFVHIRTGHATAIQRMVISLPLGIVTSVDYETVDDLRFDDIDTYGGSHYPVIFVELVFSLMKDGSDHCEREDCIHCARIRETLQKK